MKIGKVFILFVFFMHVSGMHADAPCIPCYRGENLWCFTKRIAQELCAVSANSQSCCQTLQEQINAGGATAQSCCEAQGVLIGDALSCCDAVSGRLESCCQTLQEQIDVLDMSVQSCCQTLQEQINGLDGTIQSCCQTLQEQINAGGAAAQSCCDAQGVLIGDALSCCDAVSGRLESCCQTLQEQINAGGAAAQSCCDAQGVLIGDALSCCDAVSGRLESCCQTLQEQINAGGAAAQSCCEAQGVLIGDALSCCDAVSGRLESCCQTLQEQIDVLDGNIQSCCQTLQEQINGLDGTIQSCCQTLQEQINAGGAAAQSCCDFLQSQIDTIKGSPRTGYVVFSPLDLSKTTRVNPENAFTVYTTAPAGTRTIKAWNVLQASSTQQPVQAQFHVPDDFDPTGPVEVGLHLMVAINTGGVNNPTRMRVNADFKSSTDLLGTATGGFEQTVTSSNIAIVEPTVTATLRHLYVTMPLSTTGIKPKDWGFLSFDRVAPSPGTDYNRTIYLTAVVFKYTRI